MLIVIAGINGSRIELSPHQKTNDASTVISHRIGAKACLPIEYRGRWPMTKKEVALCHDLIRYVASNKNGRISRKQQF